jgi:tetratricopeptide (TPR) repeat protein
LTSKILAARAQCALKLKKYTGKKKRIFFSGYFIFYIDALNDSNNAIQLDETNIKAYLRKGTALYNQDLKEEALKTFVRGLEIDCKSILSF